MFPCTWWSRKLNLFLIKIIFKWPTIILFKLILQRYIRSVLVIWLTISLSISHLSLSWESWRNSYIKIFFFISFRKLSIVVTKKIYRVVTKFFITSWGEVCFCSNGFSGWSYYNLEKTHFGKLIVDFHCFVVKVILILWLCI